MLTLRQTLSLLMAIGFSLPCSAVLAQKVSPERVEQIKRDAAKGDPIAETNMGYLLWEGNGVPVDKEESIAWFRKAAEHGERQAHYALGWRYEGGHHVPKDLNAALKHYTIAARMGQTQAMMFIANYFDAGKGLPAEQAQAISLVDEIIVHSPRMIADRRLPFEKKCEFFRDIISVFKKLDEKQDRLPGFEKVKKQLSEHASETSLYYTVVGDFYASYAWDARTGKTADKVSDEQFKEFADRLKPAAKALEKACELDAKNARAAVRRINVATGLGEERQTMEQWFRRAIEANPNSLAAYHAKMMYLEPKWHGDEAGEEYLSFARECGKSTDWKNRIPFLLIESHEIMSRYPRGERATFVRQPDPAYFAQESVWQDVKSVYEPYLNLNPKDQVERNRFTRFACWAKDWKTAHRQFELLGDRAVASMFGGEEELTKFKQQAAAEGK